MKNVSQQTPLLSWSYTSWKSAIRVILGLSISFKGLFYLFNIGNTDMMPFHGMDPLIDLMLFHIIIWIHFVGGIFIALGYNLRVALLPQIVILTGALFLISGESRLILWNINTEYILSSITLVLLVFYFIKGPSKLSVDHNIKMEKQTDL